MTIRASPVLLGLLIDFSLILAVATVRRSAIHRTQPSPPIENAPDVTRIVEEINRLRAQKFQELAGRTPVGECSVVTVVRRVPAGFTHWSPPFVSSDQFIARLKAIAKAPEVLDDALQSSPTQSPANSAGFRTSNDLEERLRLSDALEIRAMYKDSRFEEVPANEQEAGKSGPRLVYLVGEETTEVRFSTKNDHFRPILTPLAESYAAAIRQEDDVLSVTVTPPTKR
jgi:hypothetical protein